MHIHDSQQSDNVQNNPFVKLKSSYYINFALLKKRNTSITPKDNSATRCCCEFMHSKNIVHPLVSRSATPYYFECMYYITYVEDTTIEVRCKALKLCFQVEYTFNKHQSNMQNYICESTVL